ncbi:Os10g0351000 [Oryza sativa Japonica Group]|nr:Os10g0351000 [Oryza sativa Japonica Group]
MARHCMSTMAANTAWAACPTCTGAPPDAADISDPQQRHAGPVELPRREQVLGADPPQRAPLAARREDEHGVGGVPDPDAVPRGR